MSEMKYSYSYTIRRRNSTAPSFLASLTYKPRKLSEQNLAYVRLGEALVHLGKMGATDKQLAKLAAKGPSATFKDIAKIYCKNLKEGDYE